MQRFGMTILWAAWLGSCSAPVQVGETAVPRNVSVVLGQSRGSVVRLLPSEGAPSSGATGEIADGMLREAMRQSWWLDIAAGPVTAPEGAGVTLHVRFEEATKMVSIRATPDDVLLATARTDGRPLCESMDELAARARLALGDPVSDPPIPLRRCYSANLEVVAACEEALGLLHAGRFRAASDRLANVRRNDGACAFLLECVASAAAMRGDAAAARSAAQEALSLEQRLSPTTTHRLLRTLLLARAATEPQLATRYDQELSTLANVGEQERPFDPEPKLTKGIACNFLAKFEEAFACLEPLSRRMPRHPAVQYHLGWAALGSGRAVISATAFAAAARSMPQESTVVPRAIALHEAGMHEALVSFLEQVAAEPEVRDGTAIHEVRRMQTAHELLLGNREAAVQRAFEDLDWLSARPALLEQKAGELAELAETLVRIGEGKRLRPYLTAILDRETASALADAASFGLAMADCAATKTRAEAAEVGLRRKNKAFWADALTAYGCRQLGQLAAENQALGSAAAQSSSPLLTAALAENLRAQGREEEASNLLAALRRDLKNIHLRRKIQHPLLGPELAFAWLAQ
jgi:tetratricopeptide (TPR) repeat protein